MEISEQVIKVLDAVCDKFGIAIDWTSNNVIPYIEHLGNKIIAYDICMSIMWLIIGCTIPLTGAIFIILFYILSYKFYYSLFWEYYILNYTL